MKLVSSIRPTLVACCLVLQLGCAGSAAHEKSAPPASVAHPDAAGPCDVDECLERAIEILSRPDTEGRSAEEIRRARLRALEPLLDVVSWEQVRAFAADRCLAELDVRNEDGSRAVPTGAACFAYLNVSIELAGSNLDRLETVIMAKILCPLRDFSVCGMKIECIGGATAEDGFLAGYALETGSNGIPVQPVKAALMYEQGCALGAPRACARLSNLYEAGIEGLSDVVSTLARDRVEALRKRSCELDAYEDPACESYEPQSPGQGS